MPSGETIALIAGEPKLPPARRSEAGYNLVMLAVMVTVLNIMLAASLPLWSQRVRREREEEAIFRGLQYAEAIRVFQTRFGRFPNSVDELMDVEPRSIRRLWTNPLSPGEEQGFGLLVQAPPQRGAQGGATQGQRDPAAANQGAPGRRPARRPARGGARPAGQGVQLTKVPPETVDADRRRAERGDKVQVRGPIHGVYLAGGTGEETKAFRRFFGKQDYASWTFTPELIRLPVVVGGDQPIARVRSDWIGKPFPEGFEPNLPGARPGKGPQPVGRPGRDVGGRAPGGRRERPQRR